MVHTEQTLSDNETRVSSTENLTQAALLIHRLRYFARVTLVFYLTHTTHARVFYLTHTTRLEQDGRQEGQEDISASVGDDQGGSPAQLRTGS